MTRAELPSGVALTAYGVLFAALVTSGRAHGASSSLPVRGHTTFSLLIPAGCYLTLLSGWVRTTRTDSLRRASASATDQRGGPRPSFSWL